MTSEDVSNMAMLSVYCVVTLCVTVSNPGPKISLF